MKVLKKDDVRLKIITSSNMLQAISLDLAVVIMLKQRCLLREGSLRISS